MKKIISFLIPVFLVTVSFGQNIYYDAVALQKLTDNSGLLEVSDPGKAKSIATILRNYLPKESGSDTGVLQIFNYFRKKNPFIDSLVPKDFKRALAGPGVAGALGGFISKAGGLDVTNFADGLAKFLVERAKEELSIAFFEAFKKDLSDAKLGELRILFPNTFALLNLIDERIYQFSAYLSDLRDAFILDLKGIGYNLPAVLNSPQYRAYFSQHGSLRTFISLSGQMSQLIIHKDSVAANGVTVHRDSLAHAGEAIRQMDPDHYFSLLNNSYSDTVANGSIKLMQLISQSFYSGDASLHWVSVDSIASLAGNPTAFRLYLGLLYTRADTIYLGNGRSLQDVMGLIAGNYPAAVPAVSKAVQGFGELITEFDAYWKYKEGTVNTDTSLVYYYLLYRKTVSIISDGLSLVRAFDSKADPGFIKYLNGIGDLGEVYLDAKQEKYSLAILAMVKFFNDMQWDDKSKLVQRLGLYGSFAAEVAQAKSSDEVKTIIEGTVLPVGSSGIKKNSRFNIALNAYLGGFFGNEYLPDNSLKHWASSAGVTAPIGITFSKPLIFDNGKVKLGSISLYASILDVGAIASFRFKDSSTASLPKLSLQNIFAPGLGVVWGVPKWPLSVGYMYQWGPALREITVTEAKLNTGELNRRWYFFLAVDIPLLNVYNKPR